MQTLFPVSKWIMIMGLLYITGCTGSGATGPTGPGNNEPTNDVRFTLEGADADAQITIYKNGTPQFFGTVNPPWESGIIIGKRNDTFLMEICNSTGETFSMRMFLNSDQIESFSHQNGNVDNECSELSVTLDDKYHDLLRNN